MFSFWQIKDKCGTGINNTADFLIPKNLNLPHTITKILATLDASRSYNSSSDNERLKCERHGICSFFIYKYLFQTITIWYSLQVVLPAQSCHIRQPLLCTRIKPWWFITIIYSYFMNEHLRKHTWSSKTGVDVPCTSRAF